VLCAFRAHRQRFRPVSAGHRVSGARLESVRCESNRGFKSHPFRQIPGSVRFEDVAEAHRDRWASVVSGRSSSVVQVHIGDMTVERRSRHAIGSINRSSDRLIVIIAMAVADVNEVPFAMVVLSGRRYQLGGVEFAVPSTIAVACASVRRAESTRCCVVTSSGLGMSSGYLPATAHGVNSATESASNC
jgi:hypothetical protein